MTSTNPPLPDEPACWSWEPLPLPQPNDRYRLSCWQADRCPVCGGDLGRRWVEDHCHDTGDTRGYLCVRCNVAEGKDSHPVFALYRLRPPTAILGMRFSYGYTRTLEEKAAARRWRLALKAARLEAWRVGDVHAYACELLARPEVVTAG